MLVELGNTTPHVCKVSEDGSRHDHDPLPLDGAPAVTYVTIPDEYTLEPGADARDLALHLARNPDVTRLPGHEAFLCVVHGSGGLWGHHSGGQSTPSWVWSDNEEMQRLLSEFYGCLAGRPEDLEQTHFTNFGPPGVGPDESTSAQGV